MNKYYSKIDNRLLHIVYRKEDMLVDREDISSPEQFIQISALKLSAGKTFKPHQHIWKEPKVKQVIAQESWCVISGTVKVFFYDIDGALLITTLLHPGDISVTYEGGHTYEILEDNTRVYEYKTGPYEGQHRDKVFL